VKDDPKPPPMTAPKATEYRATLRIDEQPGGKRFQGVWLEHADGTRWVVDYRPRYPWLWFRDREVIVTGGCFTPQGQAIMAPHFRVARLRVATPTRGAGPYLEVGPEVVLRGDLVTESAPPGSKLAGSARVVFHADDGEAYNLVGSTPTPGETVQLRGRRLVPDYSYMARTDGPDLWVDSIDDADAEPAPKPPAGACP